MKTNWIDWHGGKRPVCRRTLVEVMYRDGTTYPGDCAEAETIFWGRGFESGDIVAFRIVYTADHEGDNQ